MDAEQHHRQDQRQEVVDQAVGDQRRSDRCRFAGLGHREQQHRLEDADAARHVAEHAAESGEREQADERQEAERQPGGQQDVEDRGGRGPVDQRQRDLGDGDRRPRQACLPAANRDRPPPERGREEIGRDHADQESADRDHRRRRQMQDRRDPVRLAQAGERQDGAEAEEARHRVEGEDDADVERRQAPDRVQAKAHRAAAEPAEAQIVAEGVARERGERRAPVGQAFAEVMQRQPVVEREGGVAEGGGEDGAGNRAERDLAQAGEQIPGMVLRQLPVDHPDRDREQDQAQQVGQPAAEALVERLLDRLGQERRRPGGGRRPAGRREGGRPGGRRHRGGRRVRRPIGTPT